MRLDESPESSNIEDRRDGGSGMGIARGGSVGIGTIVLALVAWYFGIDPSTLQQVTGQNAAVQQQAPAQSIPAGDPQAQFVARVLGETETTWAEIFKEQTNGAYQDPKLVLYRGTTPTACGAGQAAMGPFYCPADRKVYLDLSFFSDMQRKLNAPGDFARAYVIAHEIGHHVQNLLGQFQRYQAMVQAHPSQANQLSVKMELQADCYAGVWAFHANARHQILEPGDVEDAINAAGAVGDDRLQQRSQGRITPDSFTHGTSDQRIAWLKRGLQRGKMADCDTFAATR